MNPNSRPPISQFAVEAFVDAAIRVLYSLEVASLVQGNPFRRKDPMPNGDATGIIRFAGDKEGRVSVGFSRSFLDNRFSTPAGEGAGRAMEYMKGEIGKFTSTMATIACHQLQTRGFEISPISLDIIHGKTEALPRTEGRAPVFISFKTGEGEVFLEVDF